MNAFAVSSLAAATLALAAGSATSQALPQIPAPDGSYQEACASYRVERRSGGRYLIAVCANERGERIRSWLRLPCDGDIAVERGRLVCRAEG